jgi:hypothetical protein
MCRTVPLNSSSRIRLWLERAGIAVPRQTLARWVIGAAGVVAALPAQPLPRSNASPDLLAMLLTVKYADGLSLARFEYVPCAHPVAK